MIIPNVAYKKLGGAVPATNGYVVQYISYIIWLVVCNINFIFTNSWDDDPI
jgi:hypothetical protein